MKNSVYQLFFCGFSIILFSANSFSAGIIDQTFGTNGTLNLNFGTNTNVIDVDVNSNGKIIVAGTVANANAGKDIFVAQYNENGTLDTTFGTNGVTITVTSLDETINDSYFGFPFGIAEDIPLTGDYDADGYADFVVFRPSTRTWYMLMTTDGFRAVQFGLSTDIPVPGDYDGDGKHDIGVFRNGIWYILQSRDGFAAYQWGTTGDIPVTVRYDN